VGAGGAILDSLHVQDRGIELDLIPAQVAEHDAGGRASQQLRQLRLALAERQRSKILAVETRHSRSGEGRVD
jgi:hypothetical protein